MAYIRPKLEFTAPVWNPYSCRDIDELEKVQRRATRVAHKLKCLKYSDRLEKLNLTTLKERRVRGDCLQYFKISKKLEITDLSVCSEIAEFSVL